MDYPHTSPLPMAFLLRICWNLELSLLLWIRNGLRRIWYSVTPILIHLESRSSSGRDGEFGFAHTSNGHEACGRQGVWRRKGHWKEERELSPGYFLGRWERQIFRCMVAWLPFLLFGKKIHFTCPYLLPGSVVFLLAGPFPSFPSMVTTGRYGVGKEVIWKVCLQQEHAYCMFPLNVF